MYRIDGMILNMIEESGSYDVRKLRKSPNFGTWITIIAMGSGLVAAWATNANRLSNAEQQIEQGRVERQQMEAHISTDDLQLAALKERLQFIIEELVIANQKLDRAEEERRK